MRPLITALMFIACLLYGFMPAMASMPAGATDMSQATPMMDHGQHGPASLANHKGLHADNPAAPNPCPHHSGLAHAVFCAACLTLPATVAIDLAPGFSFAYPAPGTAQALVSRFAQPLLPPPRS